MKQGSTASLAGCVFEKDFLKEQFEEPFIFPFLQLLLRVCEQTTAPKLAALLLPKKPAHVVRNVDGDVDGPRADCVMVRCTAPSGRGFWGARLHRHTPPLWLWFLHNFPLSFVVVVGGRRRRLIARETNFSV